jgi:hypothetical protein
MNWSDFQLVKLTARIEAEEWFQLSSGTAYLNQTEADWKRTGRGPTKLEIEMTYKKQGCEIAISMDGIQYVIRLNKPWIYARRSRRSKDTEKTMKNVRELYSAAIKNLNEKEQQAKDAAEEAEQAELVRQQLAKYLGVTIKQTQKNSYSYNGADYIFQASRNFGIGFREGNDGRMEVTQMKGYFKDDQLKKLIAFMCECPQVMADRLLSGKKGER